MRKMMTLLTVLISIAFVSQAQIKTGRISGVIKDGNQKTLQSASIMLLSSSDSAVVKLSVADKEGKFQFEGIKEGKYLVSVSAIGHSKEYSKVFEINEANSNIDLKTIELVPEVKSLQGVTVTTKKPFIEQKIDRMVVNVEAAVTNVGTTALEVLEKSPGISVDKDGNISLKGKQGVQVYIDGRPSYLSGADLANLLKNMNSNQLDQIEIMTNPPAKYDAAGNSGIINIKTKKNKQFGYSGSISSSWTQHRYAGHSESVNFNYRKNKVNVFTNVGYGKYNNWNNLSIQRKFIDENTKNLRSYFDQVSRMRNNNENVNAKLGLDYSVTKKTNIGVVFNGSYSPGKFTSTSDVDISDAGNVPISKTFANSVNENKWKNFSTNLNMRHVFDSTGTELTMDADYIHYNSDRITSLTNAYYDATGIPTDKPDTLLGKLPQDINIYSYKADFSKPLKKGAKFEAGVKTSFVKTDNDAGYRNIDYGQSLLDSGRNNHFIYEENINAAYVNYSRPLGKKWNGQFGLRLENTQSKGHSTGYTYFSAQDKFIPFDSTFDRNYTQLFPTVYIQYKANEKNSFVLNYGRRINRPNYGDLNPFLEFLDKYTFEQGNPNLKPQFSHNVELSHTFKGFLTTTLNYSNTTDIIQQILEQNSDQNETFIKKSNIATERQYGISVSAGFKVMKWWNMNVWTNLYNNYYDGIVNGDHVTIDYTTARANVSNQFKFSKGWSAEISGFYTSPFLEGVFKIGDFGQVNMGMSKQVLKNKGTVRLSLRDAFYTNNVGGKIKYSDIDAAFQQKRSSRQVTVGFSYRFSKGKASGAPRRKIGGADEEQNRINTGN